jgi:transposase-like protein
MNRILAGDRLEQLGRELRQELSDGQELAGDWMRRIGKLFVEELLKGEVSDVLDREAHERRGDEQVGYRNGYKSRQLRTAEGKLNVEVPQVRDTPQPYRSPLWQALGKRTPALERMMVEMYARGLSDRDVQDVLKEIGEEGEALLSKSSVSRVTEVLWEEFEAFAKRDLGSFDVIYLFCDAVYESLRQQAGCRKAILVTWAICSDGSKVLLHLSLGSKESADSWLEHLRSLVSRNLPLPLTITTDGAPGLIKATEAMWPESERIRCWFHKMKNVLEKVPADLHETIKRLMREVRDAPDHETGTRRAGELIEQYKKELPSAMACLEDDLEATLAHLKLPSLHQKMIRTTNLCERSFVEQRRRSKVIPHFFDEKSCLKLVFSSLWRASERWRRVRFTEMEKRQLEAYIRVRQAMGKKVRDLQAA